MCIVEVGGEKIGRLQATELPMEKQLWQRITLDLNICHGKPCLRGLRYPVEFILELPKMSDECPRYIFRQDTQQN